MPHARRHFFELCKAKKSPLAKEGVDRIDVLYDIEKAIRGRSAPKRRAARQEYAVPLLNDMHTWMIHSLSQIDEKSDPQSYLQYVLKRIAPSTGSRSCCLGTLWIISISLSKS